jgi:hypothetical protein
MPLDLQIIRASEFIRLGPRNHMDFEASKEALRELARACHKRGVNRAVLDLRDLPIPPKPIFTPTELAALVESFHEAGFSRQQRLAVLYRADPHHGVRLFAFISTMRGWNVQAFSDFEQALLWLSEHEHQGKEPGEQDVHIQVNRRKVEVKTRNHRGSAGNRN